MTKINKKTISFILPTLNESSNVEKIYKAIISNIPNHFDAEIIFVDDNSPDGTIRIVEELKELTKDQRIKYIMMSRRFGDQACLMAGLQHSTGDMAILMDADLQHPPQYIPKMIEAYEQGNDVIIMQRKNVGHSSFFKKTTEILYYKLLKNISNIEIFYRFSGFCLLSRQAYKEISKFDESNPFVRGIISFIGFKQYIIEYEEKERIVGNSNYNFYQMLKLAIIGITSFSTFPLYITIYLGAFGILFSLCYLAYILAEFFIDKSVPIGWTSTMVMMVFLSGIQLVSLGIIGLYIGKMFVQVKSRPNYIIAKKSGFINL